MVLDREGRLKRIETSSRGWERFAAGPGVRLEYGEAGLRALLGPVASLGEPVDAVAAVASDRVLVKAREAGLYWDGQAWTRSWRVGPSTGSRAWAVTPKPWQ